MRSYRNRHSHRSGRNEGGLWLSFSDLMSSLLLIIILVLFYIIYQYFNMYEVNMAEIARRQYDLDVANASLDEQQTRLTAQEQQIIRQRQELETAEAGLADAQALLDSQRTELEEAQSLLVDRENEIAAQQEQLDAQTIQMGDQLSQIQAQQEQLDAQQLQIERLVGLKPRIIQDLSDALSAANISATVDPKDGSIALASDVLFGKGEYKLTDRGQSNIDAFLGVYLDVLFSDEYREYIAEVIIEGHTDSDGDYISNLELSQQRAGAVAAYVLADGYTGISAEQKRHLREVVTANGRSYSDPVLDAYGREDQDASRRVVFKFRLTDENMIEQMRSILESNDEAAEAAASTEAPSATEAPTPQPTTEQTSQATTAPETLMEE